MTSILSILLGLVVLGILVFIHELGHFFAAKACGIRVLAFSLGFGTSLYKKTVNGTEYRIGTIPFGGYVKMAGESPEEERKGSPDEFSSKPIWQRMTVAVAGPFFNYCSAFLMLWVMFIAGIERPLYLERPVIGAVRDGSIADSVGLQAGDSIVAVNDHPVAEWESIETVFAQQERAYMLAFVRDGKKQIVTMVMKPSQEALPNDPTGGLLPPLPAVVAEVLPASAAEKAGVKKDDKVCSIDGKPVHSWFELLSAVEKHRGDSVLSFVVLREGRELAIGIKPQYDPDAKRPIIGVRVSEGKGRIVRYAPGRAVSKAIDKGWEFTTMIFDVLGKLIARKVSANQLSGPLGIIPASGFMMLQGLAPILNFMALIGINLAVLNMLPLIITDGGQIVFMVIEAIRRKPLSLKTQLIFNRIAIAFFLALFLFVSFNDVKRLPEYFRLFGK
ncbi:MAG: RIP metalloprotease RseP [Chitinispirillaceae bacterium]|nr:RIP metalloprotease RseP [Chitinispirillaceae bacterium]